MVILSNNSCVSKIRYDAEKCSPFKYLRDSFSFRYHFIASSMVSMFFVSDMADVSELTFDPVILLHPGITNKHTKVIIKKFFTFFIFYTTLI
ncbi:hypothetical protein SDC9_179504 [bioreactor metagenome]|uniref:Uncharacterized protein n=1 Tax=bioreactor metagenome TaxID=1076179 RepID=A0A645GZ62_9ZZZZ